MLYRPLDVPTRKAQRISEHFNELSDRLYRDIDRLLEEIPTDQLSEQVDCIAFTPNDALPKRKQRPKRDLCHIVEQLAIAHGLDEQKRHKLIQFTIVMAEYYDILDDVIDGDVAPGREHEVIATWQVLFPIATDILTDLGDVAVSFWAPRAMIYMEAPLAELQPEATNERYEAILERQSQLFGFVTGLPPLLGDGDQESVDRAEQIGKLYFEYEERLLDCEQSDDETWSSDQVDSLPKTIERLETIEARAKELLEELPDPQAELIWPLFSVDYQEWQASVLGDQPCAERVK